MKFGQVMSTVTLLNLNRRIVKLSPSGGDFAPKPPFGVVLTDLVRQAYLSGVMFLDLAMPSLRKKTPSLNSW